MTPTPRQQWSCAICLVVLGASAERAVTLIAGDAICMDHVGLRITSPSLQEAIRVARDDLGERPVPIARSAR